MFFFAKRIAIIGYGNFAKQVGYFLIDKTPTYFILSKTYKPNNEYKNLADLDIDKYKILVCIENSKFRQNIVESLPKTVEFFTFVHPSVIFGKNVKIGPGSIILPNTVVSTNVSIGSHCHINVGNYIDYNVCIGDYFSTDVHAVIKE